MNLTLFTALLVVFAVMVSLITEAVKKFLGNMGVKYSANVVVLAVAFVVGIAGTSIAYIILGIAFTPLNIVYTILMVVAIWVGSMVGYDKVIQMIGQLKEIK